ncbi:response regulator [Pacificibacter marinus]|jgi:FixJ family two-component response regulator|uniref:Response regulator FixJ n=1 Tax=Pacificibacter marinus TaxID=658057 RepID=A0A1Y5SAZ9_9RHOB|nr:response regulator [Pacificibacter marinus]SEK48334.1 Response regulator receiver domain-containing protein [Pacificibacter marinus]SLN36501.1 response regulator FixJ [Pacificibacter marinus]
MYQLYIADDNVEFATLLSTIAKSQGWQAEVFRNGRELIEALKNGSGPAFLVVDINMPVMDGIETIDGLQFIDRPMRVRFITGGADTSLIAATMIATARSFEVGRSLFKPVSRADFTAVLAEESVLLDESFKTKND